MDQLRAGFELAAPPRKKGAAARVAAALVLLCGLVCAQGCRTASSSPRALAGAESSPEALARRFLDDLARDDLESMKRLRVSKGEFCAYVFPELPAAKTPNVTCDWVWDQAALKSMAGMSRMLQQNQGKRYELVSMRFAGTEEHDSYRVLESPVVTVRDETGATSEVRLFGSLLELDGQYKLFSFVVD